MPWHRPGDKSVSEPLMVSLLKHICITQPQWVKATIIRSHLVNSITVTNVKLCVQTQLSSGIISESVKLYVQTCHVLIVSIMCWYQQVMSDYFHIWHALCYTNKSGLSDSSYDNRGWHHRLRDKLLVFSLGVPLVGGLGARTVTVITWIQLEESHYCDIIMSVMVSQITGISIVCSTVCIKIQTYYSWKTHLTCFRVHIKGNIKAQCRWPLWGEFTSDRWIPLTNSQ